jgi:hypothetical protein
VGTQGHGARAAQPPPATINYKGDFNKASHLGMLHGYEPATIHFRVQRRFFRLFFFIMLIFNLNIFLSAMPFEFYVSFYRVYNINRDSGIRYGQQHDRLVLTVKYFQSYLCFMVK